MSNIVNISDGSSFEGLERPRTLQTGDGGGTSDDMETRVRMLEFRADQTEKLLTRMDSKLDALGRDISEIKGKVSTAPTLWQIMGTNTALFAIVLTVIVGGLSILKAVGAF